MTPEQIAAYSSINDDEDLSFLEKIKKYAICNSSVDECLQLWWTKTNEICKTNLPYKRDNALFCLYFEEDFI